MMARKRESVPPYQAVSTEIDGVTHMGQFRTERGLITVRFDGRETTTQLGGSAAAPESLARVLLSELVRGAGGR